MNMEEIVNSQEYKASKAALSWWRENKTEIDREEIDSIDAYEAGVLYGWNNPNWISVEDELPELNTAPLVRMDLSDRFDEETIIYDVVVYDYNGFHTPYNVTHWMKIQPPRKEDKNE